MLLTDMPAFQCMHQCMATYKDSNNKNKIYLAQPSAYGADDTKVLRI